MNQITNETKVIRALNAVAAGTSNQTSSAIDTQGFDGARIVAAFGAITATAVTQLKAQDSDASGSGFNDIAGSTGSFTVAADGSNDNKLVILDIKKLRKRYLKVVVVRGTANAVIDGAFVELYGARKHPTTADSTVANQTLLQSPADGTA